MWSTIALLFLYSCVSAAIVSWPGSHPLFDGLWLASLVLFIAVHIEYFQSWSIGLGLGLVVLPLLADLYVLAARAAGEAVYLTPWAGIAQINPLLSASVRLGVAFAAALAAGWMLVTVRSTRYPIIMPDWRLSMFVWLFVLLLWIGCIYSVLLSTPGTIFSSVYGAAFISQAFLGGQMYQVLACFCLLVLETGCAHPGSRRRWFLNVLWTAQLAMFLSLGDRVDILFAVMVLLLCRVTTFRRQLLILVLVMFALLPAFSLLAVVRSSVARGESVAEMLAQLNNSISTNLANLGDVGDFSVTNAAAMYAIQSGRLDLLWGRSYWDMVFRTLPKSLYPNRPESTQEIFTRVDIPTNGGLVPEAESYLNFGAFGAILVGCCLGMLLGFLYRLAGARPDFISFVVYILTVAISFRTFLYEVFDLYKVLVVGLSLLVVIAFLNRLTLPDPRRFTLVHNLPT